MSCQPLAETVRQALRRTNTRQVGALPLVYPILETLDLRGIVNTLCPTQADVDLGRVLLVLVLNRLLAPQPLCWVDRWLTGTVLERLLNVSAAKLYDQRLGRAMDAVYPQLGEIWARLVTRAIQVWHLDLSILHWDLTAVYFTGAYTDSALLRRGFSRAQGTKFKQVKLEADVAHGSRVPVGYRLLPGQTADITTPPEHLAAWLRFAARPELAPLKLQPLLVSDCKMITPVAVGACHRHGLFYLGPWAKNKAILKVLRSVTDAELAAHELSYRPQRHADASDWVPYRGVWRPFRITVPPPADDSQAPKSCVTDRVLVVWSAGKARLDAEKRRTYLKQLLNGLAHIQRHLNQGAYANRDYVRDRLASVRRGNPAKRLVTVDFQGEDGQLTLKFRLDRDRLAAAQALDGRYALGTNAAHLSAAEALAIFKAQDEAEKQFSAVKGPLAVRPVYLHTDQRIEVLVFVTLVGLLVRALLAWQCRSAALTVSVDRLLAEFAGWSVVELTLADGTQVRHLASPTDFQSDVLAALGVSACERYLTHLL